MTGFDCEVTGSLPSATAIAPPTDPVFCAKSNSSYVLKTGSMQPLYAYNNPTNVPYYDNYVRPGYIGRTSATWATAHTFVD